MIPAEHVDRVKDNTRRFLNALRDIEQDLAEYNALGGISFYESFLPASPTSEQPLTRGDLTAVMVTVGALQTLMGAGHSTNLAKFARS